MSSADSCYICNSNRTVLVEKHGLFDVRKCLACALLWVPRGQVTEKDLSKFYDKNYFEKDTSRMGYDNYLASEDCHRRNARAMINKVRGYLTGDAPKVIDIGCAFGFLLDELRKNTHADVCGVELSEYANAYAKNTLGLNVVNRPLDSAYFEKESFHMAFITGTIEHLPDPRVVIDDVRTLLKPNGVLVITTIDTGGLFPFFMIKPPEHLYYFDHDNIAALLRERGYSVDSVSTLFSCFQIHDVLCRLGDFTTWKLFGYLSDMCRRFLPNAVIKIPTNEMLVVARKMNNSSAGCTHHDTVVHNT